MSKLRIALVAFVGAVVATGAWAADMPTKAPIMPASSWAGFYVGANVGYGVGNSTGGGFSSFTDPTGDFGTAAYFAAGGNVLPDTRPKGVLGGVQAGYNWQWSRNIVLGLAADWDISGMRDSASATVTPGVFVTTTQSNSTKINWLATARAKLGYTTDNWLFYASGGAAFGKVSVDIGVDCSVCGPPAAFAGSTSAIKVGWAAGAGLDYRLGSNWTVGLEYLYFDLGSVDTTATRTLGIYNSTFTSTSKFSGSIARLNLNYKFNGL